MYSELQRLVLILRVMPRYGEPSPERVAVDLVMAFTLNVFGKAVVGVASLTVVCCLDEVWGRAIQSLYECQCNAHRCRRVTFLAARDVVEGLSVFEHAYADVGQHFNGIVGLVCAGSFVLCVFS